MDKESSKKRPKVVKIIYTFAVLSALATIASFFYPTVSDAWNRYVSSRLISEYVSSTGEEADYAAVYKKAAAYNKKLLKESTNNISMYTLKLSGDTTKNTTVLSGEVVHPDKTYESQIDVLDNGMMGYIEIPKIGVSLPIYHYTSEEVLGKGIGHLYGSSLPVGGKGTHAVLTGHCGLMDARLFTDLDKLITGDVFTVKVLDKALNYEVDQIKTVLPNDLDALSIDKDQDYVTLMTCTPYGINSHRLLVRGHRIADDQVAQKTTAAENIRDAVRFPVTIFVIAALCILVHLTIIIKIWKG